MSQENVEIVQATFGAFGSPDYDLDDWLAKFFDPAIEWHDVPTYLNAGVHFGRDAFRRHVVEYLEAWAEWSIEIEHIRAVEDRVVARLRYRGVGRQSGAPITGELTNPASGAVFELRAGRILRVRQFVTHAEALEALGLSEQDAHADS